VKLSLASICFLIVRQFDGRRLLRVEPCHGLRGGCMGQCLTAVTVYGQSGLLHGRGGDIGISRLSNRLHRSRLLQSVRCRQNESWTNLLVVLVLWMI